MSRIKGTGEGIQFLISAFNMVKRGEVKNLDQLIQFAKQQFGELDTGFMDQIKDAFKKGKASAITEKRTKDIAKGDVVEEEGLSSLMDRLQDKVKDLKKTQEEMNTPKGMLDDIFDSMIGFRKPEGSKDKAKPFRTPGMPFQKENPNYRLPGGSMYAEGNLRTAIRQFLRTEIEAGRLKVNEKDAFRVKEYSPMMEDDPIDVFRRYYGEDALQAADDMADALKEGTSFKNYEEIFRRDMPEIKVKTEGAGEYDAIIKQTEELLKKAKDDADYAKTLDEFDVADRKKNNMGGINRIGYRNAGRVIRLGQLLKSKGTDLVTEIKKAVDNIFASGDSKYDADVAVDSALEEFGVDREMFDQRDIIDAYGIAYDTVTKQRGLGGKVPGDRSFKGVEIKDPKFDENMPFDNDAEKLAEIKMSNEAYEDFDLEKGLDDLDNFRVTKDAAAAKKAIDAERAKELAPKMVERLELKQKYPGIDDDLLDNIIADSDPQHKAQVLATLDQTFKLMETGKGPDEIIDILEQGKKTRKDNAQGGLNYLMGL